MNFFSSLTALFVAFAVSVPLRAQTITLDPVIVVSDRLTRLSDTLASVTVIDRTQIEAAHANDISEILQGQAGLEVSRAGPPGSNVSVYIRGASGAQTLVLVDGVPFFSQSATGSESPIGFISVDQIERIEIQRGDASSIWGQGALGGVIHITTRAAANKTAGFALSSSIGTQGTSKFLVEKRWSLNDHRFSINATRNYTKGFSAIDSQRYPKVNPAANPFSSNALGLGWSHVLDAQTELGLSTLLSRNNSSYDNTMASLSTDDWANKSTAQWTTLYLQRQMSSKWFSKLAIQHSSVDQVTLLNSNPVYGSNKTQHHVLNWTNQIELEKATQIGFGFSRDWSTFERSATTSGTGFNKGIDINRLYVNIDHRMGQWSVGGQLSNQSRGGNEQNLDAKLSLGFDFHKNFMWLLSASHSNQLPTLGQLYDADWGGNPNLKTEKANTVETGIQFKNRNELMRIVAFQTKYRDKIVGGFPITNISEANNSGIEANLRHQGERWSGTFALTVQNPKTVDGAQLKNLSKQFGSVNVSYLLFPQDQISFYLFSRTKQLTTDPDFKTIQVAGYGVSKLSWQHQFDSELKGSLSIDNLFNKKYEQVAGYNTPGRGLFASVTYQPKP